MRVSGMGTRMPLAGVEDYRAMGLGLTRASLEVPSRLEPIPAKEFRDEHCIELPFVVYDRTDANSEG
jgi:hypothetical protein